MREEMTLSAKQARLLNGTMGQQLRVRRKSMGMSQAELADALGISFQQIQKYETGQSCIPNGKLSRICEVMQLPWDYFSPAAAMLVGKPAAGAETGKVEAENARDFLATGEGRRLVECFLRIKDARLRTQILDFIASVAGV